SRSELIPTTSSKNSKQRTSSCPPTVLRQRKCSETATVSTEFSAGRSQKSATRESMHNSSAASAPLESSSNFANTGYAFQRARRSRCTPLLGKALLSTIHLTKCKKCLNSLTNCRRSWETDGESCSSSTN